MLQLEALVWAILATGSTLFLGALLFVWHWRNPRAYWKLMAIPSRSKVPIIGDVLYFVGRTPGEVLEEYKEMVENKTLTRYQRAIMLGIPSCMLIHPDDIEVLLGRTENIKKGYEYFPMRTWLREGLIMSDGAKWRERRKLLTPTFHFRILQDSLSQISTHSEIFVSKLLSFNGAPLILEDIIKKYTLDVICETAMGINMNAQNDESEGYVQAIKRASEIVVQRTLQIWLSRDWIFSLTRMGKTFNQCLKILHGFTEKVIAERKDERRKMRDPSDQKRKPMAFLDLLLETEESNPGSLTSLDIREEVDTFMFEGHDTTAAALVFTLYSLSLHQDIQEEVYEEQLRIFGSDESRQPTMQDLQEMTYLDMVIKEVLRLYPSVPFISRTLSQDMTLGDGVVLAPGTNVAVLPYFVHRNPEFWDDPEEFRPERFTPGTNRHPYSYIPFSAGPRNCIGMKFAMMELKMTLSSVTRRCKVQPVTTTISLEPIVILRATNAIQVKIFKR